MDVSIIPRVFAVHHWDTDKKKRVGGHGDGGYIIAELQPVEEALYDCYISAGVSGFDSVSYDIINKYELKRHQCFAFDGTVGEYPPHPPTDIQFFRKNIGQTNNDHETNLCDVIDAHKNIFLKMDIEGGEFPWLKAMTVEQLEHFRQIIIEIHGCNDDGWGTVWNEKMACMEKLATSHYLVHAHGNTCSGNVKHTDGNQRIITMPDVIELTYIRKSDVGNLPLNTNVLPIQGLDEPNCSEHTEIDINCYPFVSS